ncbi:hypothetical protein [Siccirubricoccus sp. G192]|uniref:hypothetical protein n=1 Tax=Siccirubricoccus sp. G192 TaxID=2849651 RepID=UPI001C2C6ED0|nr:hypothetical protein [Siccirubricoccus sp. G192]MBV1799594.1 hypothetical protein [Siccirubricoccus sp. G192]
MSRSRIMASLPRPSLALAAGLLALAGCAQDRPAQTASTARVYAVDLQGGAKLCTVPDQVNLSADRPAEARMVMGNDGGWCGITLAQPGPRPYTAGLVANRPEHGRVHVRTVGDRTRVDYIPDRGFTGTDAFAVRMLPGNAAMQVAVMVEPGTAAATPTAAPAAAAPAAAPTRPAPARAAPAKPASRSNR